VSATASSDDAKPEPFTAPSVVAVVDGSDAGVQAALWAIDEARSRGIGLRLVWVSDDAQPDPLPAAAHAVRAGDGDIRVQTETLTGEPVAALLAASRGAAMICVGAAGRRPGSTAVALAGAAHCPVAVVRAANPDGWIVAELDDTHGGATVLQTAIGEARLRSAPLRVLGSRMVRARLDRRLSEWRRRYPDLDVEPVAAPDSILEYLSRNSGSVQLAVVGAGDPGGLSATFGTGCSILVVDRQRLL